jgi:hypothetical protein
MKKAVDLEKKPCAHADKKGRCANPENNGQGRTCFGCEDYREEGKNAERRTPNAQLSTGKGTTGGTPVPQASQAGACACEGEEGPDVTAEEVVRAYVDAVNGVLAVIRFGAMLLVKDMSLTRETHQGGCCQTGDTLKAWLQANAPDVNYKTAMRMKGTAEAVCAGLGVAAGLLLRALGPDVKALEEEEIYVRERLIEIVHGKSERSLVLWLKGGAPALTEGKDAEDAGKADELALDAARKFGRLASDALKCLDRRQQTELRKVLAKELRRELGPKGLVWLAAVIEEAEG